MVISRIGRKRKRKTAPAAEPPALTPAAGFDKPASLYEYLKNSGYLIDRTSADLVQIALELPGVKAVLLEGPPGVGKTALTEKIARWLGAEYIYVLATPNTDEDALLYKFVPDENTKSGIRVAEGPLTQAVKKAAAGKKVVLVIDEFDKTRPSTDALLLDLLQNGRVTLYLGGKEDVLVADPSNLYIFLTSNSMREFSEPLMRRLVRMDFKLLDASDVAELLRRRFDGQTADLLAEIYRDTVEAGLRKPATLQELIQLGHALKKMPDAPLDRLLRMFVIKYDDDWERFIQYLKSKRPMPQFRTAVQQPAEQQQLVEQQSRTAVQQPAQQQQQQSTERQPVVQANYAAQVLGVGVYTFKAPFEGDVYTAIAKISMPGSSPETVGKFKVMQLNGERVIVSEEPLTIDEYLHLYDNTKSGFEAYVEDKVPLVIPDDVEELINVANTVKAYSDRYVAVAANTGETEEEVHIELPEPLSDQTKLVETTVKAYAKAEPLEDEARSGRGFSPLLGQLHNTRKYICSKRLKLRKGTADVVAGIVSACVGRGNPPSVRIEGEIADRDVEEIEKALSAKGLEVEKRDCEGDRFREIAVDRGFGNSVVIWCWR